MRKVTCWLLLGAILAAAGSAAAAVPAVLAQVSPQPATVPDTNLTADEWAQRGRDLHDKGSLFPALDAFDHAIAVDTARHDIRIEYAGLLKSAGFWLRSASQYRTVLAARPDDVAARTGFGELLNAEYQFAAAVEHFRATLALPVGDHERERLTVGLATAQFGLGDYRAASATLEALLRDRPRVLPAMAFLAIAQRKMGDLGAALKTWDRFLEHQPNVSRARLHRIELQELQESIAVARQATESAPANAEAWARLGRELRRQPDLAGAREAYGAALRLSPGRADWRLALGIVLREQGRWADAAREFEAAGGDPVSGPLALYNLAHCARMTGDRVVEARAWKEASALNPGDLYAYRRWLRLLPQAGGLELERARVSIRRSEESQRSEESILTYLRLALLSQTAGDAEGARSEALEAVRIDPNDVQAQRILRDLLSGDALTTNDGIEAGSRETLPAGTKAPIDAAMQQGAILQARGRPQEAEKAYRRALELEPGDVRAKVALASALREAGRDAEALTLLEAARRQAPGYLYAQLDAALALSAAGRHAEAVEAAQAAVDLAPRSAVSFTMLASALHGAGDTARAVQALERAIALDPMDDVGAPRLLLARLYGAMGRIIQAREALAGEVPQDPEEIYRISWEFVRDSYFDRTFNGQKWADWQRRFDGRLKSTPDALAAVSLMLASLDDRNTLLRSADQTANMMLTLRSDTAEFSPSGIALTTSRSLESKRLEGNVGYIAITNLFDPSLPSQVKKAAEEVRGADAVILDLRGNQGGADAEASRIAGMFVEPGTETGKVVTPAGEITTRAEPPAGTGLAVPESKPMVVLVDHNTASSAESLAGSLREADRATLVGETTHGKAGVQFPLLLPGGTILLVVNAEHADREGKLYTGRGIRPDVVVQGAARATVATDGPQPADPAMEKAKEILQRKKRKKP